MDTVYKVKNITLDTLTRRVSVGVKSVHLTKTEYKILEYLLKNIGKAISREELLENIKGEESRLSSNMVDVHIKNLRRKIKSRHNVLIDTVRSQGYRIKSH